MTQKDYNKRNKKVPTNVFEGWLEVNYKNFWMHVKVDLPNGEYLMVNNRLIYIREIQQVEKSPFLPKNPEFIGILPKSDIISMADMKRFCGDSSGLRPHLDFIHFKNSEVFATNAHIVSYRRATFSEEAHLIYSDVFPKEDCMIYKNETGYLMIWDDIRVGFKYYHSQDVPSIEPLKVIRNKKAFILEKDMIFEAMKVCDYIHQWQVVIKKSILSPEDKNGYEYSIELEKEVPAETYDGMIMPTWNENYYSFSIKRLYALFGKHKKIILNLAEKHEPAAFTYID